MLQLVAPGRGGELRPPAARGRLLGRPVIGVILQHIVIDRIGKLSDVLLENVSRNRHLRHRWHARRCVRADSPRYEKAEELAGVLRRHGTG